MTRNSTNYPICFPHPDSTNLTLRECVYFICQQAVNDPVGQRLDRVMEDNISSYDDDDDEDNDDNDHPDNGSNAPPHIYSILKEVQGNTIPRLLYEGYIYGGYLYTLALQLIEDARHVDPAILTIEEKKSIVKQPESIHRFGVLHDDIAWRNILFEPDFGLSKIVGTDSPKLRKKKRFKKMLQL